MSKSLLLVLGLLLVQGSVLAQTNQPPAPGPTTPGTGGMALLLTLIPLVVPLLVATAKYFVDKLPGWTLPILASCLGALLNYVSGLVGGPSTTLLNGAVLGAAGVGVREILTQVKGKFLPEPAQLSDYPSDRSFQHPVRLGNDRERGFPHLSGPPPPTAP